MNKNYKILFGLLCTLLCVLWFNIMALPIYAAIDTSEQLLEAALPLTEQVQQAQQKATEEAESLLDSEAIAAVEETKKAIAAIDRGKSQEALQALERATGKLDIFLARNPKLAFIPLSSTVKIIDVAPQVEKFLKIFAIDSKVPSTPKIIPKPAKFSIT